VAGQGYGDRWNLLAHPLIVAPCTIRAQIFKVCKIMIVEEQFAMNSATTMAPIEEWSTCV